MDISISQALPFDVGAMKAMIPQMRDQFRAHLQWIDVQLCDERPWLAGDKPSLVDIDAFALLMTRRFEHRIALADAGARAEEHLQAAAMALGGFLARTREEGVGVRALLGVGGHGLRGRE